MLGPLAVRRHDGPMAVASPMQRALLARLAIDVGRAVSNDRLVEDLWGDDRPDDASNALRYHVWRLRDLLQPARPARSEGSYLLTREPGYVLDAVAVGTDLDAFERSCERGRSLLATDPAGAAQAFGAGLDLFRGEPLADVDRPFAAGEAARIAGLRVDATEGRIAADLECGDVERLVPELERLVASHPFRERFRGQLMRALYLVGRQADALRAYQDARRVLGDELGIDPSPELQAIEQRVLLQDEPAPGAASSPRRLVPAPTSSIVGRERELAELARLLERERSVTIVGPPGVGKTRLALEAARRIDDGRDVLFVDVAGVHDAADVAASVSAQLGLAQGAPGAVDGDTSDAGAVASIVAHLRPRAALLVVDNCESRPGASARLVRRLLEQCPRISCVATSRRTLGNLGERIFPLAPLPTSDRPALDQMRWLDLTSSDAERLFVERATAAGARWSRTAEEARAVVQLCERLDGLPLALELAARRARTMSPGQLLDALAERFRLLELRADDDRPPSLLATLQESRARLSDAERRAFDGLSVFVGSFDVPAAISVIDAVVGGDELSADLLDRLVDHSLVDTVTGPGGRLRMLESIRHFAGDRLAESTASAAAFGAHDDHVLALAEDSWALHRSGGGLTDAVARLRPERLEILAATARFVDAGRHCEAERLAASAGWHWLLDGRIDDARLICERVGEGRCSDLHVAARLELTRSFLAYWRGDHGIAHRDDNRAYQLAMQVGDWGLAGEALSIGVGWDYRPGWFDDDRWAVAATLFDRAGDRLGAARATTKRGAYAVWEGRHEEARLLLTDAIRSFESDGDAAGFAEATTYLAWSARLTGDLSRARELIDRCRSLDATPPMFVQNVILKEQAAIVHFEGDLDAALDAQRRLVRNLGETAPGTPTEMAARATVSLHLRELGRLDDATAELIECCSAHLRSSGEGHRLLAPWLLELAAGLAVRQADAHLAATLLAAADRARVEGDNRRPHWDDAEYERMRELVGEELGPDDLLLAESAGTAMDVTEAVRTAIEGLTRITIASR